MTEPVQPMLVRKEVRETPPAPVRTSSALPGYSFRAVYMVWFVTAVLATLIALRFVFLLLGASTGSGFVSVLYAVTDPLVAPFHGIFPATAARGSVFEPAAVVAFAVYLLLGWGIAALLRIATTPRGTRVID